MHGSAQARIFLIAVIASIGGLTAPTRGAESYRKLTDSEIKSKLTGMEVSDPHFSEQYMRAGTVRIVTMGRRIVGKWNVKASQLCIETPNPEDSECREVWRSNDKCQFRVPGDRVCLTTSLSRSNSRAVGDIEPRPFDSM
jgi:hypothetical protein